MPTETNTEEHNVPRITPSSPWRVRAVYALEDYRLYVKFMDGTEGFVDFSSLVKRGSIGAFAKLRSHEFFKNVDLYCGAVTWPDGLDIAPDAMYDAIKDNGTWLVEASC